MFDWITQDGLIWGVGSIIAWNGLGIGQLVGWARAKLPWLKSA